MVSLADSAWRSPRKETPAHHQQPSHCRLLLLVQKDCTGGWDTSAPTHGFDLPFVLTPLSTRQGFKYLKRVIAHLNTAQGYPLSLLLGSWGNFRFLVWFLSAPLNKLVTVRAYLAWGREPAWGRRGEGEAWGRKVMTLMQMGKLLGS